MLYEVITHLGKTKRDATVFADVLQELKVEAGEVLFVDDNIDHIARAVVV